MDDNAADIRIVLITVPDTDSADKLTAALLEARAAACVNVVAGVQSHYWWQGQIEHSAELLLIIKTVVGALAKLEEVVRTNHPYECPEILALPAASGATGYLKWLRETMRP